MAFAPYNMTVQTSDSGYLDMVIFGNRSNTFGAVHRVCEGNNWLGPDSWRTSGDEWSESYRLTPFGILSAPVIQIEE